MAASLYLEKGTNLTVNPPIGYSLLGFNVGVTQVTQSIVIQPKEDFLYYNKRFLKALNAGIISQSIYDTIIELQNGTRQLYQISGNLNIEKQSLIALVKDHTVQNVNTATGTTAEIIEDIILAGYQIVKKI